MIHCIILLLSFSLMCQCRQQEALLEIDQIRLDFFNFEEDLWSTIIDEQSNTISFNTNPELSLIKNYKLFGDEIDKKMPFDVNHNVEPLQNLWIYARMYSELRGVYALYETFRRFQRLQTENGRVPSPKQAWLDLAETILHDPKASVPYSTQKITELLEKNKIFEEVLTETKTENCEIQQSPHQLLYNLYNSIALVELKGYVMLQFSMMLLKLFNKDYNMETIESFRMKYREQAIKTMHGAKIAMIYAKRDLWKCDPKTHIKDETYTEVTQLLQAYIENEVDLSEKGTCFQNCAAYDYSTSLTCFKDKFCSKQKKCKGKVINCKYVDSDMKICLSDPKSGRRYDYIEYENGRVFGHRMPCKNGVTHVDSWWRWLFWHCSYCICLCDDGGSDSDRFFSLQKVISDIKNNKVVTGLRLVKKNRIIHLQIQQSELLPHGQVNSSNNNWKAVNNFTVNDKYIVKGEDFHTLSWESRDLDLDDLEGPNNYLLTGVRFKMIGTHLNFEIHVSPFNFTSGKLIQPELKSEWISNDETISRRTLHMKYKDVPTRSLLQSLPDSESNQCLEFTNTDYDLDAGQTTIPFIDSQRVTSDVILSGAGIYHKGQQNFGGFIAPKLITYDFRRHLNVRVPEEKVN